MRKLFVGLGNPGAAYAGNRHNVGFMALDRIHDRWGGTPWRGKFSGELAEATVGDHRVLLLKPATYMNESGRSVAEAARFYKIAVGDVVIAHDEIDLPPGRLKMKVGGGTGGHNGLKSIGAQFGDGTRRLRLGVGHPGRKELVPGYVLKDFAKADAEWLEPLLDALAAEAPLLAAGEDAKFASAVHVRLSGAAAAKARPPQRASGNAPTAGADDRAGANARAGTAAGLPDRKAASPFAALARLMRR